MSFLAELRQFESPSRTPDLRLSPDRADVMVPPVRPEIASPTPHPWIKAFGCAVLTYAAATTALLTLVAPLVQPDALALGSAGSALGVFVVASLLPAFITGMIVRQSRRVWHVSRIAVTYLPLFALVAGLQFAGLGGAALVGAAN
jgi:hypothetical protein